MRTSDTRYLNESFIFYEAIHSRQYFKQVALEDKYVFQKFVNTLSAPLFNKKLRYYARFIVVCLLQNKRDLATTLMTELKDHVHTYCTQFKALLDQSEWQLVLQELQAFLQAETMLRIGQSNDFISYRTISEPPPPQLEEELKMDICKQHQQLLCNAVLISNRKKQIKFSELTLDIYRMMQALERPRRMTKSNSCLFFVLGNRFWITFLLLIVLTVSVVHVLF